MRFAFIIMDGANAPQESAVIHEGTARIVGVSDVEEACAAAQVLCSEEIDCIELCGAFGVEGARRVIRATGNRIPVGYVTHLPEQDVIYRKAFS